MAQPDTTLKLRQPPKNVSKISVRAKKHLQFEPWIPVPIQKFVNKNSIYQRLGQAIPVHAIPRTEARRTRVFLWQQVSFPKVNSGFTLDATPSMGCPLSYNPKKHTRGFEQCSMRTCYTIDKSSCAFVWHERSFARRPFIGKHLLFFPWCPAHEFRCSRSRTACHAISWTPHRTGAHK